MASQWSTEEIAALAGGRPGLANKPWLNPWLVGLGAGGAVVLGLALIGGLLLARGGGVAVSTKTPTPTVTATPSPVPTATATPTATLLRVPTLAAPTLAALLAGVPDDNAGTPVVIGEATPFSLATPTAAPPTPTSTPALAITPMSRTRRPTYELTAVVYQANGNANGCQWQAVAGNVEPLPGYTAGRYNLHLFAPGFEDRNANAGSRPLWGGYGFEFILDRASADTDGAYGLQLQDELGRPLSDVFMFQTFADCARNVAVFTFRQVVP